MPNDVIAERVLDYRDRETTRSVTVRVRVFRPEEHDGRWECSVELVGLRDDRLTAYGADSAQALMHALDAVGNEVRKHKLSASAGHPWPVRLEPIEPIEAPKPPPLPPEVIAEVEVERFADEEREASKGLIQIFKPVPVGEAHWQCEYRITGVKDERVRNVNGGGSIDALLGAIFLIPTEFWHEPVIVHDGWPARDYLRLYNVEHVPLPLMIARLRRYGATVAWLADLDAGIQALRQIRRWVKETKETLDVIDGMGALERSVRYLQAAKDQVDFPEVEDWDISRIVEIRKLIEGDNALALPGELERLVDDAITSWHHMVHKIRGDE
jgi:hypothetical protein